MGAGNETRGVAERIHVNVITPRQLWFYLEFLEKCDQSLGAFRFIPMKSGKDTQPNRLPTPTRSHENKSRNLKQLATNPKGAGGTSHEIVGMHSQIQ